jgi:hypothetical protein
MRIKAAGLCGIAIGSLTLGLISVAQADDSLGAALTGGKVSLDLRYRYEQVDQNNSKKTADASTLRTALGYTTGSFYNFGAMVEFENVAVVGSETYDSSVNLKTQYSKVVDPKGTEVNQGYLSYAGLDATMLQLGRQRIILDNQRWVGNVGWRQNEQTFDGFTAVNKSLPDTQLTYDYISNVNRVSGDDATDGNARMRSHLLNASYTGLPFGALTGYAYLLDYKNAPTSSTQTLGLRFAGKQALSGVDVLYTAEYARQSDYADNTNSFDVNYVLGELGAAMNGITAKYGYEKLGSDGTIALQTPLATLHSFNGWADIFLSTPAKGLIDQYLSVGAKPMDINLAAVYHDFATDKGTSDYGKEWDLMASKTFEKKYTLGAKYANFSADSASAFVDTKKFWVWGEVKF